MKSSSQNRVNFKTANIKIIAIALLVCSISASLLSGAFILTHADHEHDHNDAGSPCATCVQIQSAENVLRLFSTAAAFVFTLFAGYYSAVIIIRTVHTDISALTPVTAKNRINN